MNKHETLFTLQDYLNEELESAKLDLKIAYNQFNNCNPEFIDFCILQIETANARLNAILKNQKQEVTNNEQGNYSDNNNFINNIINRILRT